MKKTISVLLAIMMIMLSLLPTMVLAEERDKTYDVTLGEIQQELIDYASIAGSKIVPGTDYLDELARRRSREISFSELPVEVMEQLSVCDDYFAEDRTFDVLGYIVQIASDELAEAITSLPAEKRNIILLSYFLEMTDMEIAELLNMVRSSVAYRRTATLKLLKELMGGKTDDS